jgi:ArsR family transcriptional regulator
MDAYKDGARVLRALAHPVRLMIAEVLGQEESCVCHLEARLGLRQAYVSQQLAVLKAAGLVSERRVGTFIYHRLISREVLAVLEALRGITGIPSQPLPGARRDRCGCPRCELSEERVEAQPTRR